MVNFLSKEELNLSNEFLKNGYLIKKINNDNSLDFIKKLFLKIIKKKKEFKYLNINEIFDQTHKYIKICILLIY